MNDRNALRQAKKVISRIKKINKLDKNFSLNNLVGEDDKEFLW